MPLLRSSLTIVTFAWVGIFCQSGFAQTPERRMNHFVEKVAPDHLCVYCTDYSNFSYAEDPIVSAYIPGVGYPHSENISPMVTCEGRKASGCRRQVATQLIKR